MLMYNILRGACQIGFQQGSYDDGSFAKVLTAPIRFDLTTPQGAWRAPRKFPFR